MTRRGPGRPVPVLLLLIILLTAGCAGFRSEMKGAFGPPKAQQAAADKVSVFFTFSHFEQAHGLDSVPKMKNWVVKDFSNLFRDALPELGNVRSYTTDTEQVEDVNRPARRAEREKLRAEADYTVAFRFSEETRFSQRFVSGLVSTLSLTVIPMPYATDYSADVDVLDRTGRKIKSYRRSASVDSWLGFFLLPWVPYHPVEGEIERVFADILHDVLREIENDRLLAPIRS